MTSDNMRRSSSGAKVMTIYTVRGRLLGVMAVIGAMAFVLFMTQFYNTDRQASVDFSLASELSKGLDIKGTVSGSESNSDRSSNDVKKKDIYAIVFDAGSTGSRVHVFHFKTGHGSQLKLESETFEQVKPGLSSYPTDPLQAAHSLVPLLKVCMEKVPKALYSSTPLVLKATAGLRLLPEGQADNILNEVTVLLKTYPFQVLSDAVGIMDGVDEGVFSWMTVNFMLGLMTGDKHPVPALDLGGGSTQVTFVPTQQETIASVPTSFIKNVSLFNNQYQLYTHSYLGLGLMSARFTMLGGDDQTGKDLSMISLSSACMKPGYDGKYTFGGQDYTVKGTETAKFTYDNCASDAKALVKQVTPIPELTGTNLYIFSYFFDRAVESKLIESNGGTITVKDFKVAAVKEFTAPSTDYPFQALDLTYIYALLHDGYHIADDTKVHLEKKINDVEVSWGLGAAFPLLSSVGLLR